MTDPACVHPAVREKCILPPEKEKIAGFYWHF